VPLSVASPDADRLSSVIRVPVRAVRGAVTQLDSRLVRQQCTMRLDEPDCHVEAACSQYVHTHCGRKRVGRLLSDQDSRLRTRELYTTRAVATQHRRVRERRFVPGKGYGLIGPASVHV
jgi:hypothetical protein